MRTEDVVIYEVVFTLERTYKVPRERIREGLLKLISLPGVKLPGKPRYRRTFEHYLAYPCLSFADCFYVAVMEAAGLPRLISFDRVATIRRTEPNARGEIP